MDKTADGTVVRSSVEVPLRPDAAFRLFVVRLADWWPLATHSVFGEASRSVEMEQRVGGRIVEVGPDGETADWGVVTEWDEPARLAFTWHPGQDASVATGVAIDFSEVAGGTRVDLVHSGWESRGDDAARMMESYGPGWAHVLGEFRTLAEGAV
jgi:uncharacterized protein YndB with AHSA1/START domain